MREPFLGTSSAETAPALSAELSVMATELKVKEDDVVTTAGQPCYVISVPDDNEMSLCVSGTFVPPDLEATVLNAAGNQVRNLLQKT